MIVTVNKDMSYLHVTKTLKFTNTYVTKQILNHLHNGYNC
jgi:hypothetical protein